jgi:hypothetical protein
MNRAGPPPKNGRARARSHPRRLGPDQNDENSKSKRSVTDKNIERYIIFLSSEIADLGANSLCWQFLEIGRSHYRQFRKSGSPDLRRLTWFAIQLCAKELEKEASQ